MPNLLKDLQTLSISQYKLSKIRNTLNFVFSIKCIIVDLCQIFLILLSKHQIFQKAIC